MKRLVLLLVAASGLAGAQDTIGAWRFRSIVDPMTDAARGIASTASENPVTLVVKCDTNGDNQLYFSFIAEKYLGSLSRNKIRAVTFRLDGSTPEQIMAYYDGRSASVIDVKPDNAGGNFLKRLAATSKLTVQVTNYDYDTTISVIDVTGARRPQAGRDHLQG